MHSPRLIQSRVALTVPNARDHDRATQNQILIFEPTLWITWDRPRALQRRPCGGLVYQARYGDLHAHGFLPDEPGCTVVDIGAKTR